jgi:hypothetical protein
MTGNIPNKGIYVVILTLILSGCSTYAVKSDVPCPDRPDLAAISVEEQMAMDPSTVLKIAQNQLELKRYAQKLEVRAGCADIQ